MRSSLRAFVALSTASLMLALPVAGHATPRHRAKLPGDYAAWTRVAKCESGGWRVLGSAYPDSLGITATNYEAFGGHPLRPGHVSLPQQVVQIRVADRLCARYRIPIPDQHGCAAW